jgi:hypothetical protein
VNPWLAYFLGLITIPVVWALLSLVPIAFLKDVGRRAVRHPNGEWSACYVCTHLPAYEIGEKFRITAWIESKWHRYFWSYRKWHVEAWKAHPWYRGR